jgi:DNA mismatch repair protein MutS2
MGSLSSQVNIRDLEMVAEPSKKTNEKFKSQSGKIKMAKSATISPEINLIGKTVDEAIFELDKYLDDAFLAHATQVTVIHGRGTGALRNAVHAYLKKSKYVKTYRIGGHNEGNTGATIVEFK